MNGRLMSTHEIAKLLGVSRQRASQLAQRDDFPEPIARLAACRIWESVAIEQWAREAGRID